MPLTRPEPTSSTTPAAFHPDHELSEQVAQMAERALSRVAADGAVQQANARISALQREVDQLRAEAEWREASWRTERAELQELAHQAQLDAAALRTRLEQSHLDIMEQEDEIRCARGALEVARHSITTLNVQSEAQLDQLDTAQGETAQLREQLLARERLLGAMWQTLQEYRAQGPIHRFLKPPGLPDAEAPMLQGTVDAEST